jgi:hypothetical protein
MLWKVPNQEQEDRSSMQHEWGDSEMITFSRTPEDSIDKKLLKTIDCYRKGVFCVYSLAIISFVLAAVTCL